MIRRLLLPLSYSIFVPAFTPMIQTSYIGEAKQSILLKREEHLLQSAERYERFNHPAFCRVLLNKRLKDAKIWL